MNGKENYSAVATTRPLRRNLRDIARFWLHNLRERTYFSRDERARAITNNERDVQRNFVSKYQGHLDDIIVGLSSDNLSNVPIQSSQGCCEPDMGNLQSDGKKRSKKQGAVEPAVRVTFEKVHTPAKRQAPPPPKLHVSQVRSND